MRRKRLPPDDRLDWRDPEMPVIRKVTIQGREEVREIPPKYIEQYYKNKIFGAYYDAPNWRDDPSYNWNRKVQRNIK